MCETEVRREFVSGWVAPSSPGPGSDKLPVDTPILTNTHTGLGSDTYLYHLSQQVALDRTSVCLISKSSKILPWHPQVDTPLK